jgi:hypothetical protein
MGLLDDAIREHLELKRRRGADPEEVARQESEALGDPRAPQPGAGGAEEAAESPESGDEVMPVTPHPDATRVVEPGAAQDEPELDDLAPPALDPDPYPGAADDEPGPDVDREPEAASPPAPAPSPSPSRDTPWLDDDPPTEEHAPPPPAPEERPGAVAAGDEAAADDDVLEETPDFLQETPEHDRLWFEQKPPRDFDFDN